MANLQDAAMPSPYDTARALRDKYLIPEDAPRVICVKSVPDAEPNATGIWVKVVAEGKHLNPRKFGDDKRTTMWDALSELLPDGFHAVAVQSDLKYAGKPGDWPYNQETKR